MGMAGVWVVGAEWAEGRVGRWGGPRFCAETWDISFIYFLQISDQARQIWEKFLLILRMYKANYLNKRDGDSGLGPPRRGRTLRPS